MGSPSRVETRLEHFSRRELELMDSILNEPSSFRLRDAERNGLLVRVGSDSHNWLRSMASRGLVANARCLLNGFVRYVATRHGCQLFGCSEDRTNRACDFAVKNYGVEWSN